MGVLIYDRGSAEIIIDDRALAHLKVVIVNKLRRQESFMFCWDEPPSAGSGRSCIWLDSHIGLRFKFSGSRLPPLNMAWLDELTILANTAPGLRMTPEPIH